MPEARVGHLGIWVGEGEYAGLTVTNLELQAVRLLLGEMQRRVQGDLAALLDQTDAALVHVLFVAKQRAKAEGAEVLNIEVAEPPKGWAS